MPRSSPWKRIAIAATLITVGYLASQSPEASADWSTLQRIRDAYERVLARPAPRAHSPWREPLHAEAFEQYRRMEPFLIRVAEAQKDRIERILLRAKKEKRSFGLGTVEGMEHESSRLALALRTWRGVWSKSSPDMRALIHSLEGILPILADGARADRLDCGSFHGPLLIDGASRLLLAQSVGLSVSALILRDLQGGKTRRAALSCLDLLRYSMDLAQHTRTHAWIWGFDSFRSAYRSVFFISHPGYFDEDQRPESLFSSREPRLSWRAFQREDLEEFSTGLSWLLERPRQSHRDIADFYLDARQAMLYPVPGDTDWTKATASGFDRRSALAKLHTFLATLDDSAPESLPAAQKRSAVFRKRCESILPKQLVAHLAFTLPPQRSLSRFLQREQIKELAFLVRRALGKDTKGMRGLTNDPLQIEERDGHQHLILQDEAKYPGEDGDFGPRSVQIRN